MLNLIKSIPNTLVYAIVASLILIASSLLFLEYYARRKRKTISMYRDIVYTNLNNYELHLDQTRQDIIDSLAYGIGTSTLTFLDLLRVSDNQAHVLEVLEQRFPDALGSFDRLDWFTKIENLNKADNLDAYISNFKGQEAENISLAFLEDKGFENVGLFDARNHPNNDIFAYLNGERYEFSVKSGSPDYIKNEILENDISKNYIVNNETYEVFKENGDLKYFEDNGIQVFNAGYSDAALSSDAHEAFGEILDVGDMVDGIPIIGIALFGLKAANNYKQYKEKKQSLTELKTNMLVDAGRVVVGGAFVVGGLQVGAAIGSIVPGVGTIIGAGIGAFAGGLMGNSLFTAAKENLKWGRIFKAIDYFGTKYATGLTSDINLRIANAYFDYDSLKKWHRSVELSDYDQNSRLNPYSFKTVTLATILKSEYEDNVSNAVHSIELTMSNISQHLVKTCKDVAKKKAKNNKELNTIFTRSLGSLLVENK